jgi:hypothetical protein
MLNARMISDDLFLTGMAILFVGIAVSCCVFPGTFYRLSQRVDPERNGSDGSGGESVDSGGVDGSGGITGLRQPAKRAAEILQLKR